MRILMVQTNPLVGDIPGNTMKLITAAKQGIAEYAADVIVFSELVLTAYPPEDLLLRPSLDKRIASALKKIQKAKLPAWLVVGYPGRAEGNLYNMLGVFYQGECLATYRKQCLPNYQVFDEKRYFSAGDEACVLNIKDIPVAFTICEDLWEERPMQQAKEGGAKLMININGSPFHMNKIQDRQEIIKQRINESAMPIIYVNQVGGQDELVFDGASMAFDRFGKLCAMAPLYEEAMLPIECTLKEDGEVALGGSEIALLPGQEAGIYQALVLGLRDYVNKNGFPGIVLGLSGGIDSALTLAIAVDALGAERVQAVMMPYAYTSEMSLEDARKQAVILGVNYQVIPIAEIYNSFTQALSDEFEGCNPGITEQNIQARSRGVLLMAISNKKNVLVLTTGNKSELAVGYSTLYGDMAGGFDVIKDVPKMLVYELSRYRNTLGEVIPQRVIERAPSAELAPDQVDEDNLPPYPELDQILELYIEEDFSAEDIIKKGFVKETVEKVIRLVDMNEHKRRQAPIGIRISKRGFGKDRRYPITSGWKLGE
ncbi:MAG: NAD+ synthase [SAR86 cluster bacterium]|uniref:Glutamine-dependent NAD(+) synthetase n=1 Tax=SAR86 cluster bacterium TaxID=2030880 RepID=A0A2A5CGJ2_9GAMM|nr:NAD+ synthase [Gammaproteobacteria bacterium AH-315-E17]PCJ42590.1 MAG: NAD+ synthase [SAR86 cluster bacterium]